MTRAGDQMTEAQQQLFDWISTQCPDNIELRQIALAFRTALKAGKSGKLRQWIEGARRCEYGAVVRSAYRLKKDLSAVSPPVETSWSTGQVEDQINRLKMIKPRDVLPCPVRTPPRPGLAVLSSIVTRPGPMRNIEIAEERIFNRH